VGTGYLVGMAKKISGVKIRFDIGYVLNAVEIHNFEKSGRAS